MTSGSRNLLILGIGSILIASVTTSVSLAIYRNTGDIYLDRSRPGFLPDKDEVEAETEVTTNFTYGDSGALDEEELEQYLEELQKIKDRLKNLPDAFSDAPLSDESLGIKSNTPSTQDPENHTVTE